MVKRAYVELQERVSYLKRLAFWTIRADEAAGASELFHLTGSKPQDIDVMVTVHEVDVENERRALSCYVTYQETIKQAGARRNTPRQAVFETYQEAHEPALCDLFDRLTQTGSLSPHEIGYVPNLYAASNMATTFSGGTLT